MEKTYKLHNQLEGSFKKPRKDREENDRKSEYSSEKPRDDRGERDHDDRPRKNYDNKEKSGYYGDRDRGNKRFDKRNDYKSFDRKKGKNRDYKRDDFKSEKKDDAIIIYGKHPVICGLKNPNRKKLKLFVTKNGWAYLMENLPADLFNKIETQFCEPDKLERIIGEKDNKIAHQGMALKTFALYDRGKIELINFNKIIILDDITDPHNVGAIIRSAKAFGFDAVVCEDKHSPAESATISKTSAGIIDVMPYVRLPSLFNEVTALKNAGFQIYGLDKGGEEIATHQKNNGAKIALVVGSEGKGLSPHIKRLCDKILSIKISDEVESLNASVACAVAMHSL